MPQQCWKEHLAANGDGEKDLRGGTKSTGTGQGDDLADILMCHVPRGRGVNGPGAPAYTPESKVLKVKSTV